MNNGTELDAYQPGNDRLDDAASAIGDYWKHADGYYDGAEPEMFSRWHYVIKPFIGECDFSVCVDLACGHGRNAAMLLEQDGNEKVYAVDINQENIDFCAERFASQPRLIPIRNNGFRIAEIPDGSVTYFHCFDAMVHFDSDVVREYLREVKRVLKPETGRAYLHHSNYSAAPFGPVYHVTENPASRNFMTAALFAHWAHKEGLRIEQQMPVDWLHDGSFIDCFTLLSLPA